MKEFIVVKVAADNMEVVINAGSNNGISLGQRFLIYNEGEEIIDPFSKASLGKLETVRGTGKATHVQPNLTTIRSDMKELANRTIRRTIRPTTGLPTYLADVFVQLNPPQEVEEILPADAQPFVKAQKLDKAKRI